jgi:hypothetical protein
VAVLTVIAVAVSLLVSGCSVGQSGPRFEDVSATAFPGVEPLMLQDCYRAMRTSDSIERPDARSRAVSEPLRINGTNISGTFDKLPLGPYTLELSQCVGAIGSPALAVGDLNGDGLEDLVKLPNSVWLSNGDGTFRRNELPISTSGQATVGGVVNVPVFDSFASAPLIIDIDNDAVPELLASNATGSGDDIFWVYRQSLTRAGGDPQWQRESLPINGLDLPAGVRPSIQSLTPIDFDNDGYLDLVAGLYAGLNLDHLNRFAGSNSRGVILLHNQQGKMFRDVTVELGIDAAIQQGLGSQLYMGTNTRIEFPKTLANAISVADLDNDGYRDIIVAGDFGTGMLLWNDQGTGFSLDERLDFRGHSLMGPALADINGDGYLDIFVSQIHNKFSLTVVMCPGGRPCDTSEQKGNFWWVSEGPRAYSDEAVAAGLLKGGWGWGAQFIDFDNDGIDELVQAAGRFDALSPGYPGWEHQGEPARLWVTGTTQQADNVAIRTWIDQAKAAGIVLPVTTASVVTGDFDRDGRVDMVMTSPETTRPYLFRNVTPKTGRWLEVVPVREVAGRSLTVHGARVEVTYLLADGTKRTAIRYSGTQSESVFSSSDARSWFGVGDNETVTIRITFPGGTSRVWENVTTSQRVKLSER